MYNPLKVSLENIIPLTEARDHFSQIVTEVQKDKLYVLTKGGKPAVAIVDVKYLEHITGGEAKVDEVNEEIKKAPEKVGLPPMVEHVPFSPKPIASQNLAPKPAPKPYEPEVPTLKPSPKPITPPPTIPKPTPPAPTIPTPEFHKPTPPPPATTDKDLEADKSYIETTFTSPPSSPTPNPAPKPAPTPSGASINLQTAPDGDEIKKGEQDEANKNDRTDPSDKPGPAQYAGNDHEEPTDMVID